MVKIINKLKMGNPAANQSNIKNQRALSTLPPGDNIIKWNCSWDRSGKLKNFSETELQLFLQITKSSLPSNHTIY